MVKHKQLGMCIVPNSSGHTSRTAVLPLSVNVDEDFVATVDKNFVFDTACMLVMNTSMKGTTIAGARFAQIRRHRCSKVGNMQRQASEINEFD